MCLLVSLCAIVSDNMTLLVLLYMLLLLLCMLLVFPYICVFSVKCVLVSIARVFMFSTISIYKYFPFQTFLSEHLISISS
jgi:hypothetical protein